MRKPKNVVVSISAPQFDVMAFPIVGTAPLVLNAFSQKAREQIRVTQEKGARSRKERVSNPKDFQELYRQACHISRDGWYGIPAAAFRAAMISACRLVGYTMTIAKLALFIEPDGYDIVDGTPLVRILHGAPRYTEMPVRNENGSVDLRPRPMWDPGWRAVVTVRWDANLFSVDDVTNLLLRAGMQVGIGEGRPDSPKSAGMGWGTFTIDKGGSAPPTE